MSARQAGPAGRDARPDHSATPQFPQQQDACQPAMVYMTTRRAARAPSTASAVTASHNPLGARAERF